MEMFSSSILKKKESWFHANNLVETVTETNTDITASLQERVEVAHCLISAVSLDKYHQQTNCSALTNQLPTGFFSDVVPEAEVGNTNLEN